MLDDFLGVLIAIRKIGVRGEFFSCLKWNTLLLFYSSFIGIGISMYSYLEFLNFLDFNFKLLIVNGFYFITYVQVQLYAML